MKAVLPQIEAIQLTTAQWIIAKVVKNTGISLYVDLPAVPVMKQDEKTGESRLEFHPYCPLYESQKDIEFHLSHIMTHEKADPEITEFYKTATGDTSGSVITPKKTLIIPGR